MRFQNNSPKTVEEAERDLALFLEAHPELRKTQEEISERLVAAGSIENRLNVLSIMIEGKLKELHEQLSLLASVVQNNKYN